MATTQTTTATNVPSTNPVTSDLSAYFVIDADFVESDPVGLIENTIDLTSSTLDADTFVNVQGYNACRNHGFYDFSGDYLPTEMTRPTNGKNDSVISYFECDNSPIALQGMSSKGNGSITLSEQWTGLNGFNVDSLTSTVSGAMVFDIQYMQLNLIEGVQIHSYSDAFDGQEWTINFDLVVNNGEAVFAVKTTSPIKLDEYAANPHSGALLFTGRNNSTMTANFDVHGATITKMGNSQLFDWSDFATKFEELY